MDLEIIILSEASQTEKNKYMILLICGVSNMTQVNLIHKTETDSQMWEQICGCQGGWGMGKEWSRSLGLADANYYT